MRRDGLRKSKLVIFAVFLALALLAYNLVVAYTAMIRTVRSVAQSRMEDIANTAIHKAIAVSAEKFDTAELVSITRSKDGALEAVSINSVAANRLKSEIAMNVLDELGKSEKYTIDVPIGNFSGSEFLSGVGPVVKFRIIPYNIAQIDFESKFTPAGINQVLHTLSVRVDVHIGALLPGFEEISDLTSSAIICETVIMGDVPDTYLNIQK